MYQSGQSYGSTAPKGTARTRRDRHDNNTSAETDDESVVEPACPSRSVGHSVEKRNWREIVYDERRLASYEPCAWPECFPDGLPDADIETVVRSTHQPTKFHRPRTEFCESAQDAQDRDRATETSIIAQNATRETITTIGELRAGDMVVWEEQTTPMRVDESTDETGVVALIGPDGGEYHIEERPEYAQPYYISPGVAYRSQIIRLIPDDHPRPEAV